MKTSNDKLTDKQIDYLLGGDHNPVQDNDIDSFCLLCDALREIQELRKEVAVLTMTRERAALKDKQNIK